MEIKLNKKPKNPIIIEGFPGYGLVGTIVTEFLIEHMECEEIGEFVYDDMPATIPIHQGKLVKPMAVHYSKKYNTIILHTILNMKNKEWEVTKAIKKMADELKAKEVISIEGVAPNIETGSKENKVFYFGNNKIEKCGVKIIKDVIVVGVTAAVIQKIKNSIAIFVEVHSKFPDSKAAAKIIEVLDKYLDLKVDFKPLLKQAEEFEKKFTSILKSSSKAVESSEEKNLSYLG